MSVYATQCPMRKQGNELVPKFNIGPDTPLGEELRRNYGPLIWLLEPTAAPWSRGVFEKLSQGLQSFDGEKDYLLCLGNPVLMSMMSVFAAEHSNTIRFLQFSNGQYMPLTVQL